MSSLTPGNFLFYAVGRLMEVQGVDVNDKAAEQLLATKSRFVEANNKHLRVRQRSVMALPRKQHHDM